MRSAMLQMISFCLISFHSLDIIAQTGAELSLDQAIQIALKNNPNIQRAQKEIEAAAARIFQAEAIPDPEIGISWSEVPSDVSFSDAGEKSIGLVQPLEFPGKRKARGKVARQELLISKENLARAELLLKAEVKKAYYQAVLNQKLVFNMEKIIELLRQFQEMAIVRYQAQLVPFLEVLRAKIELAKADNQLHEIQRDANNSFIELNKIIGRDLNTPMKLCDELQFQPFVRSLADILVDLQLSRPSLKIATLSITQHQALLGLAQKSYLPNISIGIFNQSLKEQPPFNANQFYGTSVSGYWQFDVGISIPLWFWKGPRGEVQHAQINLEIAKINKDAQNRYTIAAITQAFQQIKTAEAQVQTFEISLLKDIEDELQSGISLYRNNQLEALNLIDIYRTYVDTQIEYYRALYNFNIAVVELEIAGEDR